jgi:predicted TIM-barrel fold metal-dependent hydrolase
MHRALRIDRIVLVNSLVYSTDNSCMISALRGLGDKARGIALVTENVSDRELDSLHRERIRGIRLNFVDLGTRDEVSVRRQFRRASKRIEGRGWHIQIYSGLSTVDALQDEIGISPVPVVFDHFARTDVALGAISIRIRNASQVAAIWQSICETLGSLSNFDKSASFL